MATWEAVDELDPEGLNISVSEWNDCMAEVRDFLKQNLFDIRLLETPTTDSHVRFAEDFRLRDEYPTLRSKILEMLITTFHDKVDAYISSSAESVDVERVKKIAIEVASSRAVRAIDEVSEQATMEELKVADELVIAIAHSFPKGMPENFGIDVVKYLLGEVSAFLEVKLLQYPEYINRGIEDDADSDNSDDTPDID